MAQLDRPAPVELPLMMERELTTFRPVAGFITDVHICQVSDGRWYINVRVSWHGLAMFHVGLYDHKRLRLYKKLSSAVRHVALHYDYPGTIMVVPLPDLKDPANF